MHSLESHHTGTHEQNEIAEGVQRLQHITSSGQKSPGLVTGTPEATCHVFPIRLKGYNIDVNVLGFGVNVRLITRTQPRFKVIEYFEISNSAFQALQGA